MRRTGSVPILLLILLLAAPELPAQAGLSAAPQLHAVSLTVGQRGGARRRGPRQSKKSAAGQKGAGARASKEGTPELEASLAQSLLKRLQDSSMSEDQIRLMAESMGLTESMLGRLHRALPEEKPGQDAAARDDKVDEMVLLIRGLSGGKYLPGPPPATDPAAAPGEPAPAEGETAAPAEAMEPLDATQLKSWFQTLDYGGNEQVSFLEFRDQSGRSADLFAQLDTDRDGLLSFPELTGAVLLEVSKHGVPLREALANWVSGDQATGDLGETPVETNPAHENPLTSAELVIARARYHLSGGRDDPYARIRERLRNPDETVLQAMEPPTDPRGRPVSAEEATRIALRLYPLPPEPAQEPSGDWGTPATGDSPAELPPQDPGAEGQEGQEEEGPEQEQEQAPDGPPDQR